MIRHLGMALFVAILWLSRPVSATEINESIFGLTKLHSIQVTVTASDYAKMDPPAKPPFGGARPAAAPNGPAPNRPAPGSPDFGAGNFGYEFTYVPAAVTLNGETLDKVGLRYKGSGTYMMSAKQVKRSLKLDFDRIDEKQTFHGVKKLNLNSGVMDPSKRREALAYAVFNAAGVPAPKTAFAEVSLNVPDKFKNEPLGVFTVVEQIDKAFLKTHFQNGRGLLLKPEGIRGLPHFGPAAKDYEATYVPKDPAADDEWQRLIELTRFINRASEAEFQEHIGEYLDLDACAGFVAANTALASMDGFLGLGHNYYLYLVPASHKFVFIPWDLDLAFGAFPMYGTPAQMTELSIEHPHVGQNKLLDRLFAMPQWKTAYRQKLQTINDKVFAPDALNRWLAETETVLKEPLARDKAAAAARREATANGMFGAPPLELEAFVKQRKASLDSQLAGKSQGYIPTQTPFGPPPNQGLARPLFLALDEDNDGKLSEAEIVAGMKKMSRDWDTDKNGQLDQREWNDGLQKLPPRR